MRGCARARAIGERMRVIRSSTIGSLPMVTVVSLIHGRAGILAPSHFAFSRDGMLAEGIPNQETLVIGRLDLAPIGERRVSGTVRPLLDSRRRKAAMPTPQLVVL